MATAAIPPLEPRSRSGFIASRGYDAVLFILPPVLALGLAEFLARQPWAFERARVLGVSVTPVALFIGAWTAAHLFAVVFRSHANPEIFARHRGRFVAVPALLFLGFLVSDWLIVTGLVLGTFWDVYHSSMQNFGFCRIYDAKAGNPPDEGRQLDLWLCHLIYIAPIFAGASLVPTLNALNMYLDLGWSLPSRLPVAAGELQEGLRALVIVGGALYLGVYVRSYRRLVRRGYRISRQKILFLIPLAIVTVYAWSFLPVWKAYFVVNFYHGLQYFAIVWWREQPNIRRVFQLDRLRTADDLALAAFVGSVAIVGVSCHLWGNDYQALRVATSLAAVVALMHFWYDGFIWSVRKRDVA